MTTNDPEFVDAVKKIAAWADWQRKSTRWIGAIFAVAAVAVGASSYFFKRQVESLATPRETRTWYDATSAARSGNIKRAVEIADELLTANPRDFEGHYRKGEILLMAGERKKALSSFEAAANIFPIEKYTSAVDAVASLNKETVYFDQSPVVSPASAESKPVQVSTDQPARPAAGKMVPLGTTLPEPIFIGTPVTINVANLEPAGALVTVAVPSTAINLALGKAVSSSDAAPLVGDLSLVTDGDKNGDDGFYVELANGKQWVQIDLGQTSVINAVALWHFHSQKRVYHDVVIQVSDDPEFVTGVTTIFNNDDNNSSGLGKGGNYSYEDTYRGKIIDAKGAEGRYIRLYSNGNTANGQNHYIEVEVWGEPAA